LPEIDAERVLTLDEASSEPTQENCATGRSGRDMQAGSLLGGDVLIFLQNSNGVTHPLGVRRNP
jgi:hypothetical protein